jgi:hypothetical protein
LQEDCIWGGFLMRFIVCMMIAFCLSLAFAAAMPSSIVPELNTQYSLCARACIAGKTNAYSGCKNIFKEDSTKCKDTYNACLTAAQKNLTKRIACSRKYSECKRAASTTQNSCIKQANGLAKNCGNDCRTKRELCLDIYRPVCGTDGKTYANTCLLVLGMTTEACDGPCPCVSECDSRTAKGESYDSQTNPNAIEAYRTYPPVCIDLYKPVCGCDGKTYGNDCQLKAAGISKDYDGECRQRCEIDKDCPIIECFKAPCPQYSCIDGECFMHTCGNGLCEKGESNDVFCPECTKANPPCMIACMFRPGSCPQDCKCQPYFSSCSCSWTCVSEIPKYDCMRACPQDSYDAEKPICDANACKTN